jgi:hypothetical protein
MGMDRLKDHVLLVLAREHIRARPFEANADCMPTPIVKANAD